MKISVFGTGYVGLVSGVCFAEVGYDVTCVDIDVEKVEKLKKGISPIYEPGLNELLINNINHHRLHFTTAAKQAIESSDIIFIAVGTPSDETGAANLKWVKEVAINIGKHINTNKLVFLKSTVPVGTNKIVKDIILKEISERNSKHTVSLISNPEFLREGCAVKDCLHPDRIIIGGEDEAVKETVLRLYKPFITDENQIVFMDLNSSELTKYAANALLAAKISFMNEMSVLCDKLNADIEDVKRGIARDHRIGPYFINAGLGYGGSCFPKDVRALITTAQQNDISVPLLNSIEAVNFKQRNRFIKKILSKIRANSKVALWGIAFKPGTDDLRDAPALDIIIELVKNGHSIKAYDPVAITNAKKYLSDKYSDFMSKIEFCDDQYASLVNADALVIATEWESFKAPDFDLIKSKMKKTTIFDGRNIYDLEYLKTLEVEYYSVGRPDVKNDSGERNETQFSSSRI